MYKDIFEKVLDDGVQRRKQADIARDFDSIKRQLTRKERPTGTTGERKARHLHCQKPNAASTLHLGAAKDPRGSKSFLKFHQSAKGLVKDIE